MTTVLFKEESYTIIGCRMRVHSQLGSGFLEAVYEEALTKEFLKQAIPFERQVHLDLYYDGEKMKKTYRADFLCFQKIILEVKAVHHFQIYFTNNY